MQEDSSGALMRLLEIVTSAYHSQYNMEQFQAEHILWHLLK